MREPDHLRENEFFFVKKLISADNNFNPPGSEYGFGSGSGYSGPDPSL